MDVPVFTAALDVSKGSSYGRFISGVRSSVVAHAGARLHLDVVVLRPQEEDPRRALWFGVTLRCNSGEALLLRVRADNLFISGYQSQAGRWWEFKGVSVIDAATQLLFKDSYRGMEKAAGVDLEEVTLGKKELEAAARQLAVGGDGGGATQKETAGSLMVLTVMISEAIRFNSISGALGHMMCNADRRGVLPAHMVKQVKNWSSLSQNWLGAVLYGQPFPPLAVAGAGGSHQCEHIPQHLLATAQIDCQDHGMMALAVALNRQRPLEEKHKTALDEH